MVFYTTTYYQENMNATHEEMENKTMECGFYIESAIFDINIEEWKQSVESPSFVKVIPDQEEISRGTVYIIKQFYT